MSSELKNDFVPIQIKMQLMSDISQCNMLSQLNALLTASSIPSTAAW